MALSTPPSTVIPSGNLAGAGGAVRVSGLLVPGAARPAAVEGLAVKGRTVEGLGAVRTLGIEGRGEPEAELAAVGRETARDTTEAEENTIDDGHGDASFDW